MKRFWLVLLSLGLVMAFSVSAFAVDVKFSGSFEVNGVYLDQTSLMKGNGTNQQIVTGYTIGPTTYQTANPYSSNPYALNQILAPNRDNVSTAFYYQRLRIETDFIVSPGLKLVTRFDALKRIWGGNRSEPGTSDEQSIATRAEEENIALNLGYISYASPIGLFHVGYIHDNVWGTTFGDSDKNGPAAGGIAYIAPIGQFIFGGVVYKETDLSYSAVNSTTKTDGDNDKYVLFGLINFKGGSAGLLYSYSRLAMPKHYNLPVLPFNTGNPNGDFLILLAGADGYLKILNTLQPYAKVTIGPVKLEAEFWYAWGNVPQESLLGYDIRLQDIMAYVNATVDLGMFYAGGTAAYMSGDDPRTTDRLEGNVVGGGMDWNPCLIMFNQDLTYWVGGLPGYMGTYNYSGSQPNDIFGGMTNAWFFQLKGGVRPIDKLDVNASVSYAMADQAPNGYASNKSYGWELDITGTYKITNNLSYMLGVGYWWVGDYYKAGASSSPSLGGNAVRDDYMIINKLALTF